MQVVLDDKVNWVLNKSARAKTNVEKGFMILKKELKKMVDGVSDYV
jgi:hypothetical protein